MADMTTCYTFIVDGKSNGVLKTEDPVQAVDALLQHMQDNGLTGITDKRRKQAVELLRFGRVTL